MKLKRLAFALIRFVVSPYVLIFKDVILKKRDIENEWHAMAFLSAILQLICFVFIVFILALIALVSGFYG